MVEKERPCAKQDLFNYELWTTCTERSRSITLPHHQIITSSQ